MNQNQLNTQLPLLVALVFFSPLAIDIYLPALPLIAESFHVKHILVQDTIGWFMFSMGIGQLFAGPLADRYGRKTVAMTGIVIYGISSYLAALSQGIEWMLAARLIQGLGACATSVAAFATVRDIYGEDKSGQMISYLNGAICFIPALAPILGSYLTQHFGWRSNFLFMAMFALVVSLLIIFWMRETNPVREKAPVFKLERFLSVLASQTFLFHASLCMLAMAVILAYVSAAPVVLMENYGLSMNKFTFWFGLNAGVNIIAAFCAPKFMQKKGTHIALVTGISLLALGGVLILVLSGYKTPITFMLPILLSSIGFALILGSAAGKALAPFGDKAGTAAALLGLFQMSGAGVLVGTSQRLGLEPEYNIALHMLVIVPALFVLFSNKGKVWHKIYTTR